MTMYGLSMTQPWAQFVALGYKTIETRTWPPGSNKIECDFAIQAAKGMPAAIEDMCYVNPFYRLLHAGGCWKPIPGGRLRELVMPRGAVVAIATLAARARVGPGVYTINQVEWFPRRGSIEYQLGNYEVGRWMWRFENVRPLREPVPMVGHQWVWPLDEDEERQIRAQVAA